MSATIRLNIDDNPKIIIKQDYQPIIMTGFTPTILIGSGITTATFVSGNTWVINTPAGGINIVGSGITVVTQSGFTYTVYTPATDLSNYWTTGDTVAYINSQGFLTGITASMITGVTDTLYLHADALNGYWDSGQTVAFVTGYTPTLQWGNITGVLSGQTDLWQNLVTLSAMTPTIIGSGGTIVTQSGQTFIIFSPTGSTGGGTWGTITGTLSGQTDLWNQLLSKVDILHTGTTYNSNIYRTANGTLFLKSIKNSDGKFYYLRLDNGVGFTAIADDNIGGYLLTSHNEAYIGYDNINDNAWQLHFADGVANSFSKIDYNDEWYGHTLADIEGTFVNESLINKHYADIRYTQTGTTAQIISSINTYTGTTAPNQFVGKTAFNTFSGTTLPATYVNKTNFNTYTGNTATAIGLKANTSTFNLYTGTTAPATYSPIVHVHPESGVTNLVGDLSFLQTQIDNLSQIQGGNLIYYPAHVTSDIVAYEKMTTSQLTSSAHTESTIGLNNNTVEIDSFITDVGQPNIIGITSGLWVLHTHATWSSNTGLNFLHWDVYKRTTGGTETFLFRASTDDIGTTALVEYQQEYVYSGTTMNPTDRLVLKILAQTTGGAKTASMVYGGTTNFAFMQPPIQTVISNTWASITAKPSWLTGNTLGAFEAGHTHSQYKLASAVNTYTGTTAPATFANKIHSQNWTTITGATSGNTALMNDLNQKADYPVYYDDMAIIGDKFDSLDVYTGTTMPALLSNTVTGSTSLGTGSVIFASKSGRNLRFRSFKALGAAMIVSGATDITYNVSNASITQAISGGTMMESKVDYPIYYDDLQTIGDRFDGEAILSLTGSTILTSFYSGKVVEINSTGATTITLPSGMTIGMKVSIVNVNTGDVTIATQGTLQSDGTILATQYTQASAYHRGSNVWLLYGAKLT